MKKYLTIILCSLILMSCSTVDMVFQESMTMRDFAADKPFPVNVILYPVVVVTAVVVVPIAITGLAIEVYR
jgi:hypothetical protein